MATITTINSGDGISPSRTVINTNFANLNNDKIETSAIDTDTTLAANSDDVIPSQKAIKAYVDANLVAPITVETTTGTSHSLTTVAGQRVVVLVKGNLLHTTGNASTFTLAYDGVTKDTLVVRVSSTTDGRQPFSMMYTEVPAAGTRNITVSSDLGALENVVIIVLKIRV